MDQTRRSVGNQAATQEVNDFTDAYLHLADAEAPGLIEGLYLAGSVVLDDFRPTLLWGGRPRPQPAPWPAIQISLKPRQAGRGRPARVRGPAPPILCGSRGMLPYCLPN